MAITKNGNPLSLNELRDGDWNDSLQIGNYEIVAIGQYITVVEGIERIKRFCTLGSMSIKNIQKCLDFILGEPKRGMVDLNAIVREYLK